MSTGSDKFSIYPIIRQALAKHDAGVHLKTAGTTWLEEVIGLAEAGGDGLVLAKEIYAEALAHIDQVVEGVQTAREVFELAQREAVDMPITEQVYEVLYESRSPKKAVHELLARVQKAELN